MSCFFLLSFEISECLLGVLIEFVHLSVNYKKLKIPI